MTKVTRPSFPVCDTGSNLLVGSGNKTNNVLFHSSQLFQKARKCYTSLMANVPRYSNEAWLWIYTTKYVFHVHTLFICDYL